MKEYQSSENDHDEIFKENMQKRLKNLFAGQEPPSYVSLREVEAMQARIQELESKLAQGSGQGDEISELVAASTSKSAFMRTSTVASKSTKRSSIWQNFLDRASIQGLEEKRQVRLLRGLLLVSMSFFLFGALYIILTEGFDSQAFILSGLTTALAAAAILAGTRYYRIVSISILTMLSLAVLISPAGQDGQPSAFVSGMIWLIIPILLGSALLSIRGLTVLSLLNLIGLCIMGSVFDVGFPTVVQLASFLGLAAGLVVISVRHRDRIEEDRLAKLDATTKQLQSLNATLEEQVSDRTRDLTLAVKVGQRIATERDLDTLLSTAVELIHSHFDIYYVQVYLADVSKSKLTLRAGLGDVGKTLVRRGHALAIGPGSVNGSAAAMRQVVIVSDAAQSDTFLPNPLLPDTRSEMAIPMLVGDELKGVLNIQSSQSGFLSDKNQAVFETLANQLSLAVDNAVLFEGAVQAQTAVEAQARRLEREGWQGFLDAVNRRERIGYTSSRDHLQPMPDLPTTAGLERAIVKPISLLGESIGVIRLELQENHVSQVEDEVVEGVARQVAQQLENLRLLAQADQSRLEAEEATRRLTREGWEEYLNSVGSHQAGYVYDGLEVRPLEHTNGYNSNGAATLAQPIRVRGEEIGKLAIEGIDEEDAEANDIVTDVVGRLSAYIENIRLLEETQQTAQHLKEVDRLKNEFLANMSHELRTPLNSVIGYAEVLLTGLDGELDEEQRMDVQSIYDNGSHLLNLINDVLDLAKIEAGRMVLNTEEVQIAELLEKVKKNGLGMIHRVQKPLEVVTELAPDLPTIVADPIRISQVLNNLVSNAIKFSEKGTISIRAYRNDYGLSIEVKDEGIGISLEDARRIFERFTQADGSTTRRAEGTGLGLPITYHLVTMHGGSIDVKSELGHGSVFTVQLPASHNQSIPA